MAVLAEKTMGTDFTLIESSNYLTFGSELIRSTR